MERDYITPIKSILEEKMHKHCQFYMTFGSGDEESPRYYNFGSHDVEEGTRTLKVMSTQNGEIFFKVELPIDYPHIRVDVFWKQFKAFRTEFLLANYPTINPY